MNSLILSLFLAQAVPQVQLQTGVVAGMTRTTSGMPLSGIRVAAIAIPNPPQMPNANNATASVLTNASGRFVLLNLPAGKYFISGGPPESPSYFPGVIPMAAATVVTVTGGGRVEGIDFSPILSQASGVRVSGRTTNAIDPRLFNGPAMLLLSGRQGSVPLGADGTFSIENVPPGPHTLLLNAGATTLDSRSLLIGNEDVRDLQFVIPLTVQVAGRITVADGGLVPRLLLSSTSRIGTRNVSVQSRNDGSLTMLVPEGDQYIGISSLPPGYFLKSMTYGSTDLLAGPAAISGPNPSQLNIVLTTTTPPPWVRVSGHVHGSAAAVRLSGDGLPSEQVANVEAGGVFHFPMVPPGTYTLGESGNYDTGSLRIAVWNRDIDDIDFTLSNTLTIRGRIIMEDGQPVVRPSLAFSGKRARIVPTISPGTDGSFQFRIPEDEYRVEVPASVSGYRLKSMSYGDVDLLKVPLKADASQPRELLLTFALAQPSAVFRVAGRVRNFDNPQAAGKKVLLARNGAADIQVPIGPSGSFSIENVPPGNYYLRLDNSVAGASPINIAVSDRDVTNLELTFPQLVVLRAQIVMDGDTPFSAFPVTLSGSPGSFGMDPPGADSLHNFNVTLPVGDYGILFSANYPFGNGPTELPRGYSIKSMVYNGKPLPDDRRIQVQMPAGKLVITVTATGVTVGGRVKGVENLARNSKVTIGGERYNPVPGYSSDIGPNGEFEFRKVVPGSYTLRMNPYVPGMDARTIIIGSSDVMGLELAVAPRVQVKGRLILEDGIPLPRFTISKVGSESVPLRPEANNVFTLDLSAGEATFRIPDLAAGYELKSFTYGTTDLLKSTVNIDGATPQEMVIAIASAGSWPKVSGRLIGFDVLPASWRHIKLNSLDAETAADGSFEFPRVPPGDYKIWVNAPSNMAITTFTNVRVAGRDISGIELHAVRIVHTTGRVLVEGGGPVPSFEVKMIGASVPETLELNVRADGQFESNIPEAEFRLSIDRLSPGYSVRSIRGSGIDLLKNAWKPSAANAELAITFAVSSPPPWKRVSGRVLGEIPKVPAVVVNTNQTATPAGLLGGGTGAAFGGPGSGPERILLQGTGSRQEILSAVLNEDGTFVFPQVLPGTYFIRLAPVSRYIQPTTLTIRDSDISGVELSTSMDPPR